MGIGSGTAAIIGGLGAAGGVASGIIGANAAGNAASTQANAANNAAQLESQAANNSLNFNKQQYGNSLSLLSPFYNTGVSANSRLAHLMGLNPAQGLPAGVVNPNTPAPTNTNNSGGFDGSSLADLRANLRARSGGGPIPMSADGAMAPSNTMQLMQANGAVQPSGNGGSAFVGNGTTAANGGGSTVLPGGPMVSGNPGGPTGTGFIPGQNGIQQANGGGSAQISNDPNAAGGAQGGDFGSLARPYGQTFQSPTDVTEQNDPGYKFRLQQGSDALQNSAAARGGLLSGATAKALSDYNQSAASNEYSNVYNRQLQNFDTNYNVYNNDQNTLFNRLQALSGGGQTTAGQLSASGLTAAQNAGNISLTSAGQIGQQLNNAGAATGSGYINGANAINGGISSATNSLSTLALLNSLKSPALSTMASG